LLGRERAADAGAYDEHVAARIPGKALLRDTRQRASLPDRMAGAQVSFVGGALESSVSAKPRFQQNKGRPKAPFALQ
jgi:hypothetical protein